MSWLTTDRMTLAAVEAIEPGTWARLNLIAYVGWIYNYVEISCSNETSNFFVFF